MKDLPSTVFWDLKQKQRGVATSSTKVGVRAKEW